MYQIIFIGFTRRVFSMLALYVGYLSLGAIVFVYLERQYEDERRHTALTSSKLVRSMVEVLRKGNFSDDDIVGTFNEKHGEWVYNTRHVHVTWNLAYSEKVLFCMILITTIGYGNVAPETRLGKYLCILYTFFGIPLNVTFMRLLGLQFRSCLQSVLSLSRTLLGSDAWAFPVVLGGVLYFGFFDGLLIFVPAAVFDAIEDWSYLESIYYCFVSLSTIGLGDYVAGVASRRYGSSYYMLYVFLLFVWLLLGLAFVAMCLNLISYLIGSVVVDKLDCRCRKRSAARREMTSVYQCLAELNWTLAKEKPKAFSNWNVFEDFMTMCVENPDKITVTSLLRVFKAAEELRTVIFEEVATHDKDEAHLSKISVLETSTKSVQSPKKNPDAESKMEASQTVSDSEIVKNLSHGTSDMKTSVDESISSAIRGFVSPMHNSEDSSCSQSEERVVKVRSETEVPGREQVKELNEDGAPELSEITSELSIAGREETLLNGIRSEAPSMDSVVRRMISQCSSSEDEISLHSDTSSVDKTEVIHRKPTD